MPTKVKICGITRPEDADRALALGADYIGVNVYKKSPRCVDQSDLPELLEAIPREKRVLVDVATPPEELKNFLAYGFDICQIHFDLNISMSLLTDWSGLVGQDAFWAAPRIPTDLAHFPQILMEFSDTILLDTFDKNSFGGTGRSGSNWQRYLDCTVLYQHKNWILAGGLSPENVLEALRFTAAPFIDLSSGVEANPGIKDPGKLQSLFDSIREYDKESPGS